MYTQPTTPILFLAFVNNWADAPTYLRNLAEESGDFATPCNLPNAHSYKVKHEDHARLSDILDFFQNARHRASTYSLSGQGTVAQREDVQDEH